MIYNLKRSVHPRWLLDPVLHLSLDDLVSLLSLACFTLGFWLRKLRLAWLARYCMSVIGPGSRGITVNQNEESTCGPTWAYFAFWLKVIYELHIISCAFLIMIIGETPLLNLARMEWMVPLLYNLWQGGKNQGSSLQWKWRVLFRKVDRDQRLPFG